VRGRVVGDVFELLIFAIFYFLFDLAKCLLREGCFDGEGIINSDPQHLLTHQRLAATNR